MLRFSKRFGQNFQTIMRHFGFVFVTLVQFIFCLFKKENIQLERENGYIWTELCEGAGTGNT